MTKRPRIDLDGIPLHDETNAYMTVAIFRFRTTEGLVFLIPESAEVLVGFEDVESATVSLADANVRIRFREGFVEKQPWLRGARTLVGEWLDRHAKTAAEVDARRL